MNKFTTESAHLTQQGYERLSNETAYLLEKQERAMNNQQRIIKLERDINRLTWAIILVGVSLILVSCTRPPIYETMADMSCEELDYDNQR